MKRSFLVIFVLAASLALAPAASARMIELGSVADKASLNCPGTTENPCVAAVRMTGYQGRASGGPKNPYYIRRDGHLIAFTVQLAKPTEEEVNFFEGTFGTPSQARISVLRRGKTRKKRLDHRLIAQSDRFNLDRYFGSRPTFVFDEPILARNNWWRSSRPKGSCEPPKSLGRFAMEDLRDVNKFGCTYHGARLLYTVTYVPSNHITNPEEN
jgi:hypothetical protein